jgi:beta-lactamase regulating signal transducer with metallopeptidase domain
MTWLIDTALYTGALIALVLVLRGPVGRRFGPGLAYALWALPLLRLILPPIVLPADPHVPAVPVSSSLSGVVVDLAPAAATPPAPAWIEPAPVIQAVWLAGALVFLAWRAWLYREMRRSLLADARPVGDAGKVRLIETPEVAAPVAFGIFDKVVALPMGFMNRADRAGRDLAIAHELEHHAGHDLAANLAMQPLLALHWFNPLAWLGWRAMRRDQEAACDARVLAGRDQATRAAYAGLIASFAHSPRLALAAPMACPVLGDKSIIHRLRSLTMTEPTSQNRLLGRLLLGAGMLALPLTASITYAAQDAPAPPAAPAAPSAPAAPKAPEAPDMKKVTKVVIVDHQGGAVDDKSLHTKVIEKDGKTIVLKTTQPLSDEEAEKHIEKAMGAMVHADHMSGKGHRIVMVKRVDGDDKEATQIAGEHREVRTFVLRHDGKDGDAIQAQHGAFAMTRCAEGKPIEARTETTVDGKRKTSRVMICAKGGDQAQALAGLKQARERVASDSSLSAEIKAEVLKQLDAEIAKLS